MKHQHCTNGNCIHRNQGPSYEQLLEMEEKIGNVNVGMAQDEIDRIPVVVVELGMRSTEFQSLLELGDCSIWQSEIRKKPGSCPASMYTI